MWSMFIMNLDKRIYPERERGRQTDRQTDRQRQTDRAESEIDARSKSQGDSELKVKVVSVWSRSLVTTNRLIMQMILLELSNLK